MAKKININWFNFVLNRALTTSAKSKSPASDDADDEKKSPVLKGLAIINEHAMLRGNTTEDDTEVSRKIKFTTSGARNN